MATAPRTDYRVGIKDETRKGIASVKRSLGGLKASFAALGVGLSVGGLAAAVRSISNAVDQTQKLATRLGTTAADIERVGFVFERSGISIDTLGTVLQRLERNSQKAADGNKELAKAFSELGINAERFARLKPGEKIQVLAEAVKNLGNQDRGLRLLTQIGDVTAGPLVQAMQDGAAGVQELYNRFEELGGGVTQQTAEDVERFNDAVIDMKAALANSGKFLIGPSAFGPAMKSVAEWAKKASTSILDFARSLNQIRYANQVEELRGIQSELRDLDEHLRILQLTQQDFNDPEFLDFFKRRNELEVKYQRLQRQTQETANRIYADENRRIRAAKGLTGDPLKGAGGTTTIKDETKARTALNAQLTKQRALERRIAAAVRLSKDETDEFFDTQSELDDLFQRGAIGSGVYQNALENLKKTYEGVNDKNDELADSFKDLKLEVEGVSRDMVDTLFDFSKSFSEVLEDLGLMIAKFAFKRAVTDPITKFLGGFLEDSLGSLFGNATGGLYRVAGSGGERPVAFTASPGELVSVTPSGGSGALSGGPVSISFNITSLDPTDAADVIVRNRETIVAVVRSAFNRAGVAPRLA